jgi:hypothetical protein
MAQTREALTVLGPGTNRSSDQLGGGRSVRDDQSGPYLGGEAWLGSSTWMGSGKGWELERYREL